ncbi:hypothetical protein, partial [Duncaniella muris]|uniref:hypothetical protein n=1 Tax=Duncaniella muris TaxID=2094150 RepID=UPI002603C087
KASSQKPSQEKVIDGPTRPKQCATNTKNKLTAGPHTLRQSPARSLFFALLHVTFPRHRGQAATPPLNTKPSKNH